MKNKKFWFLCKWPNPEERICNSNGEEVAFFGRSLLVVAVKATSFRNAEKKALKWFGDGPMTVEQLELWRS